MTRLLVVLEVVLLLVLCCWRTSLSSTCSDSVQLCYVTMEYPDHFAINNNSLLVGLRDKIIQLSLNLEVLQQADSFDVEMNASCHSNVRNKATDCHNYHRSIIFPSGNQMISGDSSDVAANQTFIACSTNFLDPVCQYRLISNLMLVKKQAGIGFCPEEADTDTAFVEFNTTLWVGTVLRGVTNGALSQSHQPFNGAVFHATVFNSAFWLKTSSFVDMYEKGDYVYAFFREITVELNPNAVRSRVARICKSDAGGRNLGRELTTYQTYIKSTIRCAVQGVSSGEERYQNVPFYFDNLHDTTLLKSGSYSQSSVRPTQLYGVFQNSGNGPVGSVVCVYTLDHMSNDVTRVFRGDYLRRVSTTTTWERADNDNPFTCDNGRSVQDAENNIIMYNDVEQANPTSYPLYLKNGQKFHKIAVGQVRGLDDVMYEVMFIAAEDEEGNYFITKVSYVEGRGEQRSMEHDVLMLNQSDHRINHMHYHEQDDGEDMLYISTPNRLYRMNPFYCADHLTCTTCVASMDPYCVYDTIQGACVGINSANQNAALQNVTGGVANCPVVTASPTTSTTASESSLLNSSFTSNTTNDVPLPTSITTPPTNNALQSSGSSESDSMWGWFGIGAGVGICVGIVIGVFFMFAWQRRIGFLRYCNDDQVDGPCGGESSSKGAYGSDDEYYKKSAANVENGTVKGDPYSSCAKGNNDCCHGMANGRNEYYSPPAKGNNNYNVDVDPPKQLLKYDQSNASKYNQSLHERRTSQPAKVLKMHESPQRLRSHSLQHGPAHAPVHVPVSFTSQAVTNRDMARYGSNYSLDPDTSKPTLTPTSKNRVHFNTDRDSVDLDQTLHKSTDC